MPYHVFRRRHPKKTGQEVDEVWAEALENSGGDALFRRGEWCLPSFEGVFVNKRKTTMQQGEAKRSKAVDSAEQLQELQASTKKTSHAWLGSHSEARTVINGDSVAPDISVSESDRAPRPAPTLQLSATIAREACCAHCGWSGNKAFVQPSVGHRPFVEFLM